MTQMENRVNKCKDSDFSIETNDFLQKCPQKKKNEKSKFKQIHHFPPKNGAQQKRLP